MTTEKHFALSHAEFWHQLIPTAESYVREINVEAARFLDALDSQVPPNQRGVVNEAGFRIFEAHTTLGTAVAELPKDTIAKCVDEAVSHVAQMRLPHQAIVLEPSEAGGLEALELAERLVVFFSNVGAAPTMVSPPFPGCGWLDSCRADVLAGHVLFEVKAGERGFRSGDIRQTLCYAALNFSSKSYTIDELCLVNPRQGRYICESIEVVCQRLSGRSASEVLGDIVSYVSEPLGRYATG